ncbi:MAG: phosphoribosylaminoimidazolesuccinocarboxamide synthase [Gemmataceae bacterium]|nr:phosphoribosylaminoimidazolesuccinocarboxamide synthase [Gemmataceae bacterium]
MRPLYSTNIPNYPCRRGKVRDVYDLGDRLVIIATDRISAFDWVLPTPVPDKGRILTGLTRFWLEMLGVPNHFLSDDLAEMGPEFVAQADVLAGRTMLVKKAEVVPIECVVRGYLAGSSWKEYSQSRRVCGIPMPLGLVEGDRLMEPIFTPATKEESGHDVNISFAQMGQRVGFGLAAQLRDLSIEVYRTAAYYARCRGILIADTKFEWGRLPDGEIILVDEVLTPDSSRFWPASEYRPGTSPPSFDKQYVRDWLSASGWDKNSPPPELPPEVVDRTRAKYIEAYERLTGETFNGQTS